MSRLINSRKRIVCLLLASVVMLSGILGYMFLSQKEKRISSKAIRWYNGGLTNTTTAFEYWIDKTQMNLSTGYMVQGWPTGNLMWTTDPDGKLCVCVNNYVHSPESKNKIGILLNHNIGSYTTTAGNPRNSYDGSIAGSARFYFPDAVVRYDGSRYGLYLEISDVKIAIKNGHKNASYPIIFRNKGTVWHDAYNYFNDDEDESHIGTTYNVRMWVNSPPSNGYILNTFKDIDQPDIWGNYGVVGGEYQEGFKLGSGCINEAYTDANTDIVVYTDEWVRGFRDDPTNNSKRSCASFLGLPSGFTYQWSGYQCGSMIGITGSDVIFDYVNVSTNIYFEDKEGVMQFSHTPDTKRLIFNMYYSYTWPVDYSNDKIYQNGNFTVGGNITYDRAFDIKIYRRWYDYRFDFDTYCPSGHTSAEIGNKQDTIHKRAENLSGDVKTPTLTGYTFLNWVHSDSTGYQNEAMLSNKTFYATWRKNKYYVQYNGNGSTNFNHQTGEFTQNTVRGSMAKSEFEYDTKGTLRKNAYTREGYVFTGWNTKADGTGVSYSDQYDNVWNWSSTDGAYITLYAQWKKVLGTETITVVSEETGRPVANVSMQLQKKVNGTWTNIGDPKTTAAAGQIRVSNLHWFDYRWVMTSVPAGYFKNTETPASCYTTYPDTSFRIKCCGTCGKSNCDDLTVTNTVILYMKHVNITLDSQVDCIIKGEDAPAFLYHIDGTDAAGVKHEYNLLVQTNKSSLQGTSTLNGIFAGTYKVTQTPVYRYVPRNAQNKSHATINGTNATVNVLDYTSARVLFPYTLTNHGWWSGVDSKTNKLRKQA